MRRFARAAIEVVRLACARERLDDAPPAPPGAGRERAAAALRLLFSVERLEPSAPAADVPRRHRWLGWLFSVETLEHDAPAAGPARPRGGWLRWIFAPEPLPFEPEPPRGRRRGGLAALFAPERLDDSP